MNDIIPCRTAKPAHPASANSTPADASHHPPPAPASGPVRQQRQSARNNKTSTPALVVASHSPRMAAQAKAAKDPPIPEISKAATAKNAASSPPQSVNVSDAANINQRAAIQPSVSLPGFSIPARTIIQMDCGRVAAAGSLFPDYQTGQSLFLRGGLGPNPRILTVDNFRSFTIASENAFLVLLALWYHAFCLTRPKAWPFAQAAPPYLTLADLTKVVTLLYQKAAHKPSGFCQLDGRSLESQVVKYLSVLRKLLERHQQNPQLIGKLNGAGYFLNTHPRNLRLQLL